MTSGIITKLSELNIECLEFQAPLEKLIKTSVHARQKWSSR